MLIDKDRKKKDPGTSTSSVTKMGEGGHVITEVLAQICTALKFIWTISWRLSPKRVQNGCLLIT